MHERIRELIGEPHMTDWMESTFTPARTVSIRLMALAGQGRKDKATLQQMNYEGIKWINTQQR
jgi:hypothetical protein